MNTNTSDATEAIEELRRRVEEIWNDEESFQALYDRRIRPIREALRQLEDEEMQEPSGRTGS